MSETVNLVLKTTAINPVDTPATYFGLTVANNIGTVTQNRSSITAMEQYKLKKSLG